jgi:hypothetical protein
MTPPTDDPATKAAREMLSTDGVLRAFIDWKDGGPEDALVVVLARHFREFVEGSRAQAVASIDPGSIKAAAIRMCMAEPRWMGETGKCVCHRDGRVPTDDIPQCHKMLTYARTALVGCRHPEASRSQLDAGSVEAVARAMYRALDADPRFVGRADLTHEHPAWEQYLHQARAAIAAMPGATPGDVLARHLAGTFANGRVHGAKAMRDAAAQSITDDKFQWRSHEHGITVGLALTDAAARVRLLPLPATNDELPPATLADAPPSELEALRAFLTEHLPFEPLIDQSPQEDALHSLLSRLGAAGGGGALARVPADEREAVKRRLSNGPVMTGDHELWRSFLGRLRAAGGEG